jgi:hypothetical protein
MDDARMGAETRLPGAEGAGDAGAVDDQGAGGRMDIAPEDRRTILACRPCWEKRGQLGAVYYYHETGPFTCAKCGSGDVALAALIG